jgi:hypothetical protein
MKLRVSLRSFLIGFGIIAIAMSLAVIYSKYRERQVLAQALGEAEALEAFESAESFRVEYVHIEEKDIRACINTDWRLRNVQVLQGTEVSAKQFETIRQMLLTSTNYNRVFRSAYPRPTARISFDTYDIYLDFQANILWVTRDDKVVGGAYFDAISEQIEGEIDSLEIRSD